jgi:hypothetical protein
VDGRTYQLIDNGDGTWSKEADAPEVSGNYSLLFEISENGIISFLDSADDRYTTYLRIIEGIERKVFLINYLPDFLQDIFEYNVIFDIENLKLDKLNSEVEKIKNDMFIKTASNDAITRLESFLRIKGQGTLEQRKSYLVSLIQKGKKLNEQKIRDIANTITGSDCIITFYGADELNNPEFGYSLLMIQVLSPDNNKDYRYEDIARALKPLVPGHLKLLVIKFYATWFDVISSYASWLELKSAADWQLIKDHIPLS